LGWIFRRIFKISNTT